MTPDTEECALPLPFLALASLSTLFMFLLPLKFCMYLIPAAEIGLASLMLQSCAGQHFCGISARMLSLRMIAFLSACKAALWLLPASHGLMLLVTALAGYIQIFIMMGFANRPFSAVAGLVRRCIDRRDKHILNGKAE